MVRAKKLFCQNIFLTHFSHIKFITSFVTEFITVLHLYYSVDRCNRSMVSFVYTIWYVSRTLWQKNSILLMIDNSGRYMHKICYYVWYRNVQLFSTNFLSSRKIILQLVQCTPEMVQSTRSTTLTKTNSA